MTSIRRISVAAAVALGAATVAVAFDVAPASAATITVTTTADELNGDGDCSLREAVQAANTDAAADACPAGGGADIIVIPAGTYELTSQLVLDDVEGVTLQGAGAASTILSGGDATRLVDVAAGGLVAEDLTFTAGAAGTENGGAIRSAGAASVVIASSVFDGNQARNGGAVATGSGALEVDDSTFRENRAFLDELNGNGGAISAEGGSVEIRTSTFDANTAANVGGAVVSGDAPVDVTDTAMSGNTAKFGAAIYSSFAPVTVVNSTFDANVTASAVDGYGGSIETGGFGASTITLVHVTLTGNTGDHGIKGGSAVTLTNSVIADNEDGDCFAFGDVTSDGGNLDTDGTCVDDASDVTAAPMLGALADNGGPTSTRLPSVGSPLIDGGVAAGCESADQRGIDRPQDGDGDGTADCDRGAVELAAAAVEPIAPTVPVDSGTAGIPAAPAARSVAATPRFVG